MPAEIRNSTFPTTVVDLLLPPASATARSGSDEAFDSLLRTLSAAENAAPREASSSGPFPSQPTASERRSEGAEYSPPPVAGEQSPVGRQRDDADRSASQNEPVAAQQGQPSSGQAKESAESDEQAVGQAQPATGDQAEEPKAADESGEAAVVEPDVDEAEDVDAIDPTALQIAAVAAQATAAKNEQRPTSSGADEGKSSQEQQPLADAGNEAVASTPTQVVASPLAETAGSEPISTPATKVEAQVEGQVEAIVPEAHTDEAAGTPATEDGLVDPELLAADQVEAKSEEEVVISEVKSTRTGARQAMFHETPPQQDEAAAVDGEAADSTAAAASEAADASSASEPAASLSAVEALSDSPTRDEGDRSSPEPQALDANEAVSESAAAETPAMEAALAEAPPVESGVRSPAETARSEQRSQQPPPTLIDANQRPVGAPRLAAEVLAGGSREASHSRPIEIDSARFLTRVAKAFTAAQQRGGEVQLRLSPPELGSLRVEVKVLDGVMTARVETENAAAKSAVLEHLPQLRERLAEQGVRIERFDVDLMQNGSTGTPDRPADRQAEETFPRRQVARAVSSEGRTSSEPRAASANLSAGSGLNVIV